jgi:hypothetical protein
MRPGLNGGAQFQRFQDVIVLLLQSLSGIKILLTQQKVFEQINLH